MKNLKKLSRTELKALHGGVISAPKGLGLDNPMGGGSGDTFKCCSKTTGSCGPCGGPGTCDAGYYLTSC